MYRYRPTGISSWQSSERKQSNHSASALVQRPHEDSPTEPQAQPCGRLGIRVRELRCDLFSVNSLAAAMHVRKAEIRYWIEQGWLEAVRKDQGRSTCYNISPEALQRCIREHLAELQKRNIRSSTILAVFNQFCYVPKHTTGEQLLQGARGEAGAGRVRLCNFIRPLRAGGRCLVEVLSCAASAVCCSTIFESSESRLQPHPADSRDQADRRYASHCSYRQLSCFPKEPRVCSVARPSSQEIL